MPSLKFRNPETGEFEKLRSGVSGMSPSVYDPQGKQTDIFAYVDDKAGEGANIAIGPDAPTDSNVWIDTSANPEGGSEVVASFNGRSGIVVPQAGDYTAEMVGADASGAAASALTDAKAYTDDKVSNPNILHNWHFANPIDQRGGLLIPPGSAYAVAGGTGEIIGTTEQYYPMYRYGIDTYKEFYIDSTLYATTADVVPGYAGKVYGIDRWTNSSVYTVMTVGNGYITIVGVGGTGYLRQYIENPTLYFGRTITISVLYADGTLYTSTGTAPSEVASSNVTFVQTTDHQKCYMAVTLSSAGVMYVQFRISEGYSADLVAAKLELGSIQTLAHQDENGNWVLNEIPDYNEELLSCCMSKADSSDTYANNYKTPAAIGALNKAGDTMTGTLQIQTNNAPEALSIYNGTNGEGIIGIYNTKIGKYILLQVRPDGEAGQQLEYRSNDVDGTILHTGNKDQIFTYGTEDLTAGTSELETGKLYFVYE